jgi:hypothetical protein
MSNDKYFPPTFSEGQFNCPHCGVFAKQFWSHIHACRIWGGDPTTSGNSNFDENLDENWKISKCGHCGNHIIWFNTEIIYPEKIVVDSPNDDLSQDIKKDYIEAAQIFNKSPRGAAALLRLALQKLLKQLGESGENINEDIKNLISKGLNQTVQKGLDFVRVTGNNAVHPGQIDLDDNKNIALKLFKVINFIAEKMITEPNEVEKLFDDLPEEEKDKINNRNSKIVKK